MRKLLVSILTAAFVVALLTSWCMAQNFPAQQQAPAAHPAPAQPRIAEGQTFYGYVPPPPVRQTWPGGYKVIFHELTNTLMEHILGQY